MIPTIATRRADIGRLRLVFRLSDGAAATSGRTKMWEFLSRLLDTSGFPDRWHCGTWSTGHGLLHILSDLGIWGAYLAIPCVLVWFASHKPDLPFRRIFWLFGAFILACGTTHLMEAIVFWWPAYRLVGVVKLLTALISWGTVAALVPTTPRALALRTPQELDREMAERKRVEQQLRDVHAELERRVTERTAALTNANEALQSEIQVRERFEQALASAREWFEVTLASIGDAVIVADTEGRVTFLNQVARELTGRFDDVRGHRLERIFQVVSEDSGQPAVNPAERVLGAGTGTSLVDHAILVGTDGTQRPIDESVAPIRNAQGEILGVVLVFRDVTERRRSEEALRRSEESLREADRRKDQFLAMLGHELRNPLSGITSAIQVLSAIDAPGPDAAEMRRIIERQTAHMARLIDDLLEVSRISRGKIQLRRQRLDLADLVRTAVADVRPILESGRLAWHLELPGTPAFVSGDPTRLSQVFVNLLQNAAKFTNPGGRVDIAVEVERGSPFVNVTVRDTGIGIRPESLPRIFEPFSQADSSLERSRGGLGLGLALVKGLVELHGGQVSAASEGPGRGAEFRLRLPMVTEAAVAAAESLPIAPAPPKSKRILIIDDQRAASIPLQKLLELDGHCVEAAGDGPTGVDIARRFHPDAVLCDIGLPGGMSGYAVARAIRADESTRGAYLVAVTGYGRDEDRRAAEAAGFDRHLTKPVSQADLRSLLAALPDRSGKPQATAS